MFRQPSHAFESDVKTAISAFLIVAFLTEMIEADTQRRELVIREGLFAHEGASWASWHW